MPRRRDSSTARSTIARVCVRAAEMEEFREEARARHTSISSVIYCRLRNSRPRPTVLDGNLASELGRIGANLNQLTRKVNAGLITGIELGALQSLQDMIRTLRITLLGGAT